MHIGTKKGNRGLLMLIPLLAVLLWMALCPLFGNTSIKLKWSISIYLITELMLEIKHYCVQRRDWARGGKVNWMWHKVFAAHILFIEFYFWPPRPRQIDISVSRLSPYIEDSIWCKVRDLEDVWKRICTFLQGINIRQYISVSSQGNTIWRCPVSFGPIIRESMYLSSWLIHGHIFSHSWILMKFYKLKPFQFYEF